MIFICIVLKVYTEPNTWDCVATCFFIDCANNICSFIETIFNILKSGNMQMFKEVMTNEIVVLTILFKKVVYGLISALFSTTILIFLEKTRSNLATKWCEKSFKEWVSSWR